MKKIEHLIYSSRDDESSRITHAEEKIDELVNAVNEEREHQADMEEIFTAMIKKMQFDFVQLEKQVAELQKIEATKQKQWNELQEATNKPESACDCNCHKIYLREGYAWAGHALCNECVEIHKPQEKNQPKPAWRENNGLLRQSQSMV